MADVSSSRIRFLMDGYLSHRVDVSLASFHTDCGKKRKRWHASLIRQEKNKYVLQFSDQRKSCLHTLPPPGSCLLVRVGDRRLVIFPVKEVEKEHPQITLEFNDPIELLLWEEKFRRHLKVYTFLINLCPDQVLPSGPSSFHVTSKFLVLTKSSKKGPQVIIYEESMSNIIIDFCCLTDELTIMNVKSCIGPVDRIHFTSRDLSLIKEHTRMFSGSVRTNSDSASSTSEDSGSNNTSYGYEKIETSGYLACTPGDFSTNTDSVCAKNTSTIGSDGIRDPTTYLEILPPYEKPKNMVVQSSDSPPPLPPRQKNAKNNITMKSSLETVHGKNIVNDKNSVKRKTSNDRSRQYQPLSQTEQRKPEYYASLNKGPMLYNFIDFDKVNQEPSPEFGRYVNVKAFKDRTSEDMHSYGVFGRSLTKDNSGAPPRPPRNGKKSCDQKPNVTISAYLFGAKAVSCQVWSFALLLTRCEDQETFQRLKSLEDLCGNELLRGCRAIVASGDIAFKLQDVPEGFNALSSLEQKISLIDLKQLSPLTWITLEFHFICDETMATNFRSQLMICPSSPKTHVETDNHKSVFGTQSVLVLKELVKVEETRRKTSYRIPLSLKDRIQFCQKMDFNDALGKDWKWFAGELGFNIEDVRTIQINSSASYTEQVLCALERSKPELCNLDTLRDIVTKMKRFDALEHLV